MVKFICNKIGRDNGLESFKTQGITPHYKLLTGEALGQALKEKLIEETQEVCEAVDLQELTAELADVLEVINGLCKVYNISQEHLKAIQEQKYQERGGFEQGFFVEALEMAEGNPRAAHFRKSPDKYPEFSTKK
jgi:predicted house-cleaning noncanonical NTP pyrophosphatase (MazG superfamily)